MTTPPRNENHHNDINEIDILLNVSKNIVGTLDLQKILEETVNGISELFIWGTAAIYLLEDSNRLRLYATHPELPPNFPEKLRIISIKDHPHLARVIKTAQPVYIPDTLNNDLSPEEKRAVEERQLRTLYFIPLVADQNALGAFIVGSFNEPVVITARDISLLTSLANFAALAIKNARLFSEKYAYTAELEWTIAQRDAAENERRRLQEDLFQVQKLDAIGKLAGGIAHDFNNQLSGILGYGELLQFGLEDEKLNRYAAQIVTIARRSAELISRLLVFSRKCPLINAPVDLSVVINEVAGILHHTISPQIKINVILKETDKRTLGDPTQIQSALLNLAINARDAMPKGGTLDLVMHNDTRILERETRVGPFMLIPGEYIIISVNDTGIGMNQETIDRIYEPYFTTKKEGKGTGMGLAAVFGTMKSHGGGIEVNSQPGVGTTFQLFFPLAAKIVQNNEKLSVNNLNYNNGQALVIDDIDYNVETICINLNQFGYKAKGYTCPDEAINYLNDNNQEVSFILLDIMMPNRSLADIFYTIKDINSSIPIILMSGYAEKKEVQALIDAGAGGFIQKPFSITDLINLINQILIENDSFLTKK